jgi:hypothetical protein
VKWASFDTNKTHGLLVAPVVSLSSNKIGSLEHARTHACPAPSPPRESLTESCQTSCRRRSATAIARRRDTHNRLLHLLFVASSWKILINPHPPRSHYRLQLLLHLNWLLRPNCPPQNNPLEPQRQEEEEEHSNKGSFIPSSETSLLPWKLNKSLNCSSGPDLHRNHSLNCSSDPDPHRNHSSKLSLSLSLSLSLCVFFLSPTRAAQVCILLKMKTPILALPLWDLSLCNCCWWWCK